MLRQVEAISTCVVSALMTQYEEGCMRGDARALGPCDPHANLGEAAEVDANCVTLSTASHCPSTNRAALRPAPQRGA